MRAALILFILLAASLCLADEQVPELKIELIQEGVYLHTSYKLVDSWGMVGSNGLIVVEDNKAFIVDTPWSEPETELLVDWIKSNNYELLGSVSTHSHEDRTSGIAWLNAHNIPTYATEQTNSI